MRYKKIRIIVAVVLIVTSSLTVCSCSNKAVNSSENQCSYSAEDLYTIETSDISDYVVATGTIDSGNKVLVQSSYPGLVDKVYVKKGDCVKKGDMLFSYSDKEIQTELNNLRAQYDNKNENLKHTHEINLRNLENAQNDKNSNIEKAQKNIDFAVSERDSTYQKYQKALQECDSISADKSNAQTDEDSLLLEEKYNQKVDECNNLADSLNQCENNIDQLNVEYLSTVRQGDENIQSMQDVLDNEKYDYSLSDLQAQISDKEEIVKNLNVTALTDGVITELNVQAGMVPSGSVAAVISETDKLTALVHVNEEDIRKVADKMPASITLTKEDITLEGTVSWISMVKDEEGQTYSVMININNSDKMKVFLGMSVSSRIITDKHESAMSVPYDCLNTDTDGRIYVLSVGENEQLTEKVYVETGIDSADRIEIISDELTAGTKIVMSE